MSPASRWRWPLEMRGRQGPRICDEDIFKDLSLCSASVAMRDWRGGGGGREGGVGRGQGYVMKISSRTSASVPPRWL